ncbi:MAG: UbiA family prenyltransferase [Vicinamibacterales bacterium]
MQHTGRSALRLLHYWWPLGVGWSYMMVVQRATSLTPNPFGLMALLSGILAAYSVDRVVDPGTAIRRPVVDRLLMLTGCAAGLICLLAALRLPLETAAIIPVLGFTALVYSRLKRHVVVKTVLLPAVWIWAALALPFNDGSWLGWHVMLQPITVPLLLLNTAGCLLCDLKDEVSDRQEGVRSLAAVYGGSATIRTAAALSLAAAGLAIVEHRAGLVFSAAALGAAMTAPSILAIDVIGPLMVDVILTLPGILISTHVV